MIYAALLLLCCQTPEDAAAVAAYRQAQLAAHLATISARLDRLERTQAVRLVPLTEVPRCHHPYCTCGCQRGEPCRCAAAAPPISVAAPPISAAAPPIPAMPTVLPALPVVVPAAPRPAFVAPPPAPTFMPRVSWLPAPAAVPSYQFPLAAPAAAPAGGC